MVPVASPAEEALQAVEGLLEGPVAQAVQYAQLVHLQRDVPLGTLQRRLAPAEVVAHRLQEEEQLRQPGQHQTRQA